MISHNKNEKFLQCTKANLKQIFSKPPDLKQKHITLEQKPASFPQVLPFKLQWENEREENIFEIRRSHASFQAINLQPQTKSLQISKFHN